MYLSSDSIGSQHSNVLYVSAPRTSRADKSNVFVCRVDKPGACARKWTSFGRARTRSRAPRIAMYTPTRQHTNSQDKDSTGHLTSVHPLLAVGPLCSTLLGQAFLGRSPDPFAAHYLLNQSMMLLMIMMMMMLTIFGGPLHLPTRSV